MELSSEEKSIVRKRMEILLYVWDLLLKSRILSGNQEGIFHHLNKNILGEVITHYIYDVRVLKQRYNIPERINFAKIAGLMTFAILKYKPIVPRQGDYYLKENSLKANEIFAMFHGLSVLFDFDVLGKDGEKIRREKSSVIKDFLESSIGQKWKRDFKHLLYCRNYTAENLVMTFESLCATLAPELLNVKIGSEG
jgi:hypothetical protein